MPIADSMLRTPLIVLELARVDIPIFYLRIIHDFHIPSPHFSADLIHFFLLYLFVVCTLSGKEEWKCLR